MNRTRSAFRRSLQIAITTSFLLPSWMLGSASAATVHPPVYAHRGGTSVYVENTRAAFRASGTRLWEADIRFTSTGYPVLLHDPDLGRFGCPALLIAELSTSQARTCKAANRQTITTLGQFTADLKAYDALALVELKITPTRAQWERLESAFAPVNSRIVVQSFRTDALTEASRRGYTTAFLTLIPATAPDLPPGTDWYAPRWDVLALDDVTAMHAAGIKVVTWSPGLNDWPLLPAGLDAIISDDINSVYRQSPIERGPSRAYRP